ncbi:MAG TPA: glutamate--tRNA ligase [Gammaproteobacteria bacterium]|nr:glutamate--tRNA ligase [Gammaproteobacteria bacterium]
MTVRTRFAPSPTGHLHVGNARTALFNALFATRMGGTLILRIEDTDAERSRREYEAGLIADLCWLGIAWQEGPDCGGTNGPYRQSERGAIYAAQLERLAARERVYPCFCTPAELALARKAQLASGKPPRYAGTCAHLDKQQIEARLARGLRPALRFRVPAKGETVFDDLVRGRQVFANHDIGDFIIRRADGSPAFFFSNAVDDALMGVTHVLRGEDHLANTPRQLLLLEALELGAPSYGHLSLIVGEGGAPLSKREGGGSLADLRTDGILPAALMNYLARLGHTYSENAFMDRQELAQAFDIAHIGHSPAHFDHQQLEHWQREALQRADAERVWEWLTANQPQLPGLVPEPQRDEFVATVRGNITRPGEALHWARVLNGEAEPDREAEAVLHSTAPEFFRHALDCLAAAPPDFRSFAQAVSAASGRTGRSLYMPLRAALTGRTHGPEMERLWKLLPATGIERQLQRTLDNHQG